MYIPCAAVLPVLSLTLFLGVPVQAEDTSPADSVFIVTGFKAFDGRGKNGSETIVNALQKDPAFATVTFRILDVAWGPVDRFCADLKTHAKIRGVSGIGEGFPHVVTIEMYGRNTANGKDEAGVEKTKERIDPAQPEVLHSRMKYAISDAVAYQLPLVINNNAGDFLCNYELFHLNGTAVPVSGFVHVPPQGEVADEQYVQIVAPLVKDILLQNVDGAGPKR
jgi:pyrrolidone-carboxylate peptidase